MTYPKIKSKFAIGHGGVVCECCRVHGKNKPRLNRDNRRKAKILAKKDLGQPRFFGSGYVLLKEVM